MTSIGNSQQSLLAVTSSPAQTLSADQRLDAKVLGPTRHGVSVLVGRETLQLDVPSRLSDAGTLTLQGTGSSSASGQGVLVVARDGRSLSPPISATLASRRQASQLAASTIVQTGRIDVIAQPISPEGKASGAGIALQLRAQLPESSLKGPVAAPISSSAATASPSAGPTSISTSNGQASGGTAAAFTTSGKGRSESPTGTATSAISSQGQTTLAAGRPADLLAQLRAPPQTGTVSISPTGVGGEHMPSKANPASVLANYRSVAATQSTPNAQLPTSGIANAATDRDMPTTVTVVGRTNTGQAVIRAADQLLRIEQPLDLPLGTTLQAALIPGSLTALAGDVGRFADPATPLAKLIELLDDIDRAGRQTAEPDLPKQLPQPDKNLASRFLALMAGEGGAASQTEAPSSGQGGAGAVRDQIQSLVRDLGGMASETLAEGWKSLTLPLGSDQAQAVCFFFKDHELDPDEGTSDDEPERLETQRAVFDVSFSQLGRCQVDALCQGQRFDLLVRSERPLSQEDREVISALFQSASEIAGMKGDVGFHLGNFFEPPRSSTVSKNLTS